ncbi:MAG: L-carnitine dehydratase [Klenkia sp.]|nr:L-carnitine dehydratase [Klenkia sp.]
MPSAPINDVNQALADPQATARGLLAETEHPHWGTVRQVGSPVRFGEQPVEHRRAAHRNEHQHDITAGLLGYPAERTAALEAAGAVGRQES